MNVEKMLPFAEMNFDAVMADRMGWALDDAGVPFPNVFFAIVDDGIVALDLYGCDPEAMAPDTLWVLTDRGNAFTSCTDVTSLDLELINGLLAKVSCKGLDAADDMGVLEDSDEWVNCA